MTSMKRNKKTLRLFQASSQRKTVAPGDRPTSSPCSPHALPCKYLPRTQVHCSTLPSKHTRPFSLPNAFNHYGLSSQHAISLQHNSSSPGIIMFYETSVQQGTKTRRQEDYGHTYTHDPPFSKRRIGLTPHSPSGRSSTEKGNSLSFGTLILNKLRPLAPMPMSHVSQQRPRDAAAITQSYCDESPKPKVPTSLINVTTLPATSEDT